MTFEERLAYAAQVGHDVILTKDNDFTSGKFDEIEYAESKGWTVVCTVRKYAYKETRKTSRTALRQMCIDRNWFTCGDLDEYEELLNYADKKNITTDDLVEMAGLILEYSDKQYIEGYDCQSVMFAINDAACVTLFDAE